MFIILPPTHKKSANGPSIFDDARQRRAGTMKDVSENGRASPSYKSAGIERRTCFPIQAGARLENSCDAPRYFAFVNGSVMNLEGASPFPSLARVKKYIIFSLDLLLIDSIVSLLKKGCLESSRESGSWMDFERRRKRERERFFKNFVSINNYLTERIDSLK